MKKIQLTVALLGLAMAACTNNEEFAEEVKGIETISAEIIQPMGVSSRIIVGDKDSAGNYPMRWRADNPATKPNEADVIYVYDSKGNAARFVYSEPETSPKGIFTRDTKVGAPIEDIKNALCVPSSVGNARLLPTAIDATFNYMSTMMYTRGAENAPMYGEFDKTSGTLQFKIVTGMLELNIPNLAEFRPNENSMLGVQVKAYGKDGKKKIISGTQAKLDFTQKENPVVSISGGDDFIGLFIQKGVAMGNKLYIPMVTGEYSKIELSLWPNTSFKDEVPSKCLSEVVTLAPKGGAASFTIEKKLYSVTRTFVKKSK